MVKFLFCIHQWGAPLEEIKTYIQNQKTYDKGVKNANNRTNKTKSKSRIE